MDRFSRNQPDIIGVDYENSILLTIRQSRNRNPERRRMVNDFLSGAQAMVGNVEAVRIALVDLRQIDRGVRSGVGDRIRGNLPVHFRQHVGDAGIDGQRHGIVSAVIQHNGGVCSADIRTIRNHVHRIMSVQFRVFTRRSP